MLNWKAVVVGTVCFSSVPTFSFLFSSVVLAGLFLPRKFYYLADGWFYDHYNRMMICFYHNLARSKLVLYGDVDVLRSRKENALCISNHQTGVDWPTINMLCALQGDIGRTRYVAKDELKLTPIVGPYLRARGCVYVKRGKRREGAFDEAYTVKQLDRLRNDNVPLWLIIYPEGTRFSPDKREEIERSQAFARANGLAVCDELLTPRSKAVYLALRSLGSHFEAVYDFTVGYTATLPKVGAKTAESTDQTLPNPQSSNSKPLANQVAGDGNSWRNVLQRRLPAPGIFEHFVRHSDIHVHVSRIPIADVPQTSDGEEPIRRWLSERFALKEQLMKKFLYGNENERGSFGENGVEVRFPLSYSAYSVAMFAGFNTLLLYSASGRYAYAAGGALATALGYAYVFVTG